MLDLGGDICYNVITSKGFFFFVKEPVKIASEYVVQCFLHLSKCGVQVRQSAARPREAFTFTLPVSGSQGKSKKYFRKAGGAVMRVKITLACTECKQRNYNTMKNKKNDPDRLEMNKYCRFCKKHTLHKETK